MHHRIGDLVSHPWSGRLQPRSRMKLGIIIGSTIANESTLKSIFPHESRQSHTPMYYVFFPGIKSMGPYFESELKSVQNEI